MPKKYYAVRQGRIPGIYTAWDECSKQVNGYSGAVYKSFTTIEDAQAFLGTYDGGQSSIDDKTVSDAVHEADCSEDIIAYVDGSYDSGLKRYAYGCVILFKGKQIELSGSGNAPELVDMRNVAGEILGSAYAIKWAVEHGVKSINVFHDYEGIARWADGEWKANKEGTRKYKDYIAACRKVISIKFTKVAAHTGVELNERADELAKAALKQD